MIFEKTLTNGLELVVRPTNAPVASVQVWVDVGSIDEKPLEAGYCHFLEHMLFKGTRKRTTAQIAGTVEGSGGEMNAFTSFEYTVYHITLSNQRWELANEILADMVLGSTFLTKEFNPEKEVILEEIRRSEDSPDRQLYRGIYSQLYGTLGYGRPVIGFPTTVRKCTAGGLKQFWRKWYSPELMTVVVCGDVDPLAVEEEVRKTWGGVRSKAPRVRRRELGFDQRIPMTKSKMGAVPFPVNAVRWVGAIPGCNLRDSILPALDISSMIIGQGESSRLYKRLFRDEQLVTSVSAGVWAPAGIGMYSFDVEAPVEHAQKFRKPLWEEVVKFCDEGPTADEIERAKVAVESDRIYGMQSMDGLANRLGFLKTALGNVRFDLEYMADAKDLTAEDIRNAARQYLDASNLREFALLPKSYAIKNFWNGMTLSNPRTHSTVAKSVVDREQISLSNGIELILYPRQDVPLVSLQACALGGLRAETRKNSGVGNILSDVWEKGPVGWTALKFSEYLERRGSRIDSFSGRNSLGLSATLLTSYIEDVLPLYAETLLNPALEEEEFSRARKVALEDIVTLQDDLGRLVGRMFSEALFEGHPYAFPIVGYKDSVESMQAAELREHYLRWVRGAPLVVAASGKFNPSYVISVFEKLKRPEFNAQKNKSKNLSLSPISIRAPRVTEIKKNREQSHLIIGFQGTSVSDVGRYDLKVLLTVLGGQSGRLFTELRDKQGLCYTVAPISFEGIEPGYVGVYMGCDPSKRTQATQGILDELQKLAAKPISASELKRSKEFVLGRYHMDLQMNAAVASSSAFNTLYGLGFDEHLKLSENLKKVNSQSIQKLAQKIFNSPAVSAFVI